MVSLESMLRVARLNAHARGSYAPSTLIVMRVCVRGGN